jgi:hypothetical protein
MELRKTNNFSGDNVIYFAGGCDCIQNVFSGSSKE